MLCFCSVFLTKVALEKLCFYLFCSVSIIGDTAYHTPCSLHSAGCLLPLPPATCLLPPISRLLPPSSCLLSPDSCHLNPAVCHLSPFFYRLVLPCLHSMLTSSILCFPYSTSSLFPSPSSPHSTHLTPFFLLPPPLSSHSFPNSTFFPSLLIPFLTPPSLHTSPVLPVILAL